MKHPVLVVLSVLTLFYSNAQNNLLTQTVRGTVIDEQSGHVIADATVMIDGSSPLVAVVADAAGNFRLTHVPIGRQTIRVSFTGYEEAAIQNIEVTSSKEVVLEIKLKEKVKN